jgi:thiosulfate/3-mercaptopyruvate sulfurtransferase
MSTPFGTLLAAADLQPRLDDPSWAVIDCRFDLDDHSRGQAAYLEGHIPGAIYAHLDRDLAAPPNGSNGRHPLPPVEILAAVFSRWGIGDGVQVVAYDDSGGPFAARLWWCLHYLGHEATAVLDGGLAAWKQEGLPLRAGSEERRPREFHPAVRPSMRAEAAQIVSSLGSFSLRLIDARAPERFRGEEEPIDPVAGHIPGAVNHPWQANLGPDGRFLPAAILRADFEALLGGTSPKDAVTYCGSGVTATHNLLALAYAGLEGARLYPGSWSEWCSDLRRPVARGPA